MIKDEQQSQPGQKKGSPRKANNVANPVRESRQHQAGTQDQQGDVHNQLAGQGGGRQGDSRDSDREQKQGARVKEGDVHNQLAGQGGGETTDARDVDRQPLPPAEPADRRPKR